MKLPIPTGRKLAGIAGSLLIVLLSLLWLHTDNHMVTGIRERLERIAYDLRLSGNPFGEQAPHPAVVIIDIDEHSLSTEGRWPWPRRTLSRLLEQLHKQGVVVSAIDAVFSEPEPNPATVVAQKLGAEADPALSRTLQRLSETLDGDTELARALESHDIVLGQLFSENNHTKGRLGPPLRITDPAQAAALSIDTMPGHTANLPLLSEAAPGAGFFNITPDADGQLRRYNLLIAHNGELYPFLALETLRLYLLQDEIALGVERIGGTRELERVLFPGTLEIPTDERGRVIIPYRPPQGMFDYLSASDVLNGSADPQKLRNRIALIGSSAKGLFDLRSTPLHPQFPGVEVHATVIAGILDYADIRRGLRFPHEPKWAEGVNFTAMILLGLLLSLTLPFAGVGWQLLINSAAAGSLAWFSYWIWSAQHLVVGVTSALMMVLALALYNLAIGFTGEVLSRHRLKEMFGQYVPQSLVERMNRSLEDFGFEGDRRQMTVLFADIQQFTRISEDLPPRKLARLLNLYLSQMTRLIFEQQGTVDKYVGDMVMAFWGAPLSDPEHARHGLESALRMREGLERLKLRLAAEGLPAFEIGIGVNSGEMSVGNMGSIYRKAYTVLGDSVNLGSRLEGLTRYYGVTIIVGEQTREGQEDYLFRRLDRVRVKGRSEPETLYELVGRRRDADAPLLRELERHEAAMAHYFAGEWSEAQRILQQLSHDHPARAIHRILLERLAAQRPGELPRQWDGVFNHTSK
ncbi:MAG: adenylate/guanylate cyclase domain-containing protein [gamma proteobacterium symbiont of Phacoides pectinatus]